MRPGGVRTWGVRGEALPRRIGRYSIKRELGRGMMGVVYEAVDTASKRRVALKVIRLVFPVTDEQRAGFEQRFLVEARIVAHLDHPGIVTAWEVGREEKGGSPYIALEYLEGRTLSQVLQEGPRPAWRDSLRIAARLAEALHYAHQKGVVHRDVKPANVMLLTTGQPKLMDFGLAKLQADFELTATGQFMGTPLYMSPEQATGKTLDGRSDLFSLGTLLYTLLTGQRPFEADSVPRILNRVTYDDPPPPSSLQRGLPAALDDVLARALAKSPEDRYPGGASLAEDLEDVLAGRPPRHLARWTAPERGEQTLASPTGPRRRASEGDGARQAASRARLGRDETRGRLEPVPLRSETARPRRSAPLALLGFGMLAIGGLLYGVVLWLDSQGLGYGQLPPPVLATPAAPPADLLPASPPPEAFAEPVPGPVPSASLDEPVATPAPEPTPLPPGFVGPPEPTATERLGLPAPTPSPSPSASAAASPSASPTPTATASPL